MTKQFDGRVAFVTGAAGGIGLATAKAFADECAAVVLVDLDQKGVEEGAAAINRAGGRALGLLCDISEEASVEATIDRAIVEFGKIDFACNNAGIHVPSVETAEARGEDFDKAIAVNLRGVWNCMKYELKHMRERGDASIVNVSSNSGVTGIAGLGAYTASKHGVIGLTKSAALEYATKGIRINVVCPGPVQTPMVDKAMASHPESMQSVIDSIPLKRMGRPEEIASAILWFCNPLATFAIGSVLLVDGGYSVP